MKKGIQIEDYQLQELKEEKLYINKYSMDLLYSYELNRYWKEFFFDLLEELFMKGYSLIDYSFNSLKKYYKDIIRVYKLKIDIKDYVELCDFITYDE